MTKSPFADWSNPNCNMLILCDNQSCIKRTENPIFHDRSKHIEIRYHYIRDMVQRGALKLQYISTDEQVANVLTKPLYRIKFEYFRDTLGMVRKDPPRKGGVDDVMRHLLLLT
jgi:hypothetical protein